MVKVTILIIGVMLIQRVITYIDCYQLKGNSEKIACADNETFAAYDNMRFVGNTNLNGNFIGIDIIDNTVLIVSKNLCIGSDKIALSHEDAYTQFISI